MTNTSEIGMRPVRRLLRRRGSPTYYRAGGWTENAAEAQNFTDVLDAVETCVHRDLKDVELVLRIEDARSDIFCTGIR